MSSVSCSGRKVQGRVEACPKTAMSANYSGTLLKVEHGPKQLPSMV